MMRPQALMEAVSATLNWFLQPIGEDLTKPQKKLLRDSLIALLRAGRPVVCRMARKLPDRGTQFLSPLDRLEGHLNASDDLDPKVRAALPNLWLPMVREHTAIIQGQHQVRLPMHEAGQLTGQPVADHSSARVVKTVLVGLLASRVPGLPVRPPPAAPGHAWAHRRPDQSPSFQSSRASPAQGPNRPLRLPPPTAMESPPGMLISGPLRAVPRLSHCSRPGARPCPRGISHRCAVATVVSRA